MNAYKNSAKNAPRGVFSERGDLLFCYFKLKIFVFERCANVYAKGEERHCNEQFFSAFLGGEVGVFALNFR